MRLISKAAGAAAVALTALAASAGAGCTASSEDVNPDPEQVFFPTGAATSPDGELLFVANANSDLTYNSGQISVLPLDRVDEVIAAWLASATIPSGCDREQDFTETLGCDERLFLSETRDMGVRIGNFATDLAVQDLGGGALRLVVPTRGDPSITWADFRPGASPLDGRLTCNDDPDETPAPNALCEDGHRLSFVHDDVDARAIPEEPFGVYADSAGEFAVVTHLTTGSVTLVASPRDAGACSEARRGLAEGMIPRCVQVADIAEEVFQTDPATGARGATSVVGRPPGGLVYVGSRSEDRVQMFTVGTTPPDDPSNPAHNYRPPFLLMGSWIKLDGVGNNAGSTNASGDTRGMAFSPSGDRLYLVNRRPPSLQIYDTSIGPTGVPRNDLVGAVDICRQASTVTVTDSGDGERVYVTCFQDGQVYVIDPRGRGRVDEVITVGRGPYAAVAAAGRPRLYVTNFLEDTIAVIDLTPGSPTRNRVALRIGLPREP